MFLSQLINSFSAYIDKRQQLGVLLTLSDRQLRDCGIAPELLAAGVAGYPWQTVAEPTSFGFIDTAVQADTRLAAAIFSARELERNVTELSSFSDSELKDLGVSRGAIREAVQHVKEEQRRHGRGQVRPKGAPQPPLCCVAIARRMPNMPSQLCLAERRL